MKSTSTLSVKLFALGTIIFFNTVAGFGQCHLAVSASDNGRSCVGADTITLRGGGLAASINWIDANNLSVKQAKRKGVTVAGDANAISGTSTALLSAPTGVFRMPNGDLYIADKNNNRIQKWAAGATSGVTVAGDATGTAGLANNQLNSPAAVYVTSGGDMYISDANNNRVQKWVAGASYGTTVAGDSTGIGGIDDSLLSSPWGVWVDASGNIYVADANNNRVQKFAPGSIHGTTVAGDAAGSFGPSANLLYSPANILLDGANNLYIGDAFNNRIQKYTPGATSGITVAGDSNANYGTSNKRLYYPFGVALVGTVLYIADGNNNRIQRWVLGDTAGMTVAGSSLGRIGGGDSLINFPLGVAADSSGAVYIADINNNRIEKWGGPDSIYVPTAAGTYRAVVTSVLGCIDFSNTVVVSTSQPSSVSITASSLALCAGTADTFTATPSAGATPSYQWYINGTAQGGATASVFSPILANNDTVWVVMNNATACVNPVVNYSNKIGVNVTPSVTPTISIAANKASICAGASDTFTATITNGGASPAYQWNLNGVAISGATSNQYNTASLTSADSISATLVSNATCALPASVTSAPLAIAVIPSTTPSITLSGATTICAGVADSFFANVFNAGATPTYQWYRNGTLDASSTRNIYKPILNDKDSVKLVVTSSAACASPAVVTSSTAVVTVNPTVVPTVTITGSDSFGFCNGNSDTLKAISANGGASPTYIWSRNGTALAITGDTYYHINTTARDSIRVTLLSNAACAAPRSAASYINVTSVSIPKPIVAKSGKDTLSTGPYTTYKWLLNNNAVVSTSRKYIALANGSYRVVGYNKYGCSDTSAATVVVGLAISEQEMIKLKVYPNPTETNINIDADIIPEGTSIVLVDMIGKKIYTKELNGTTVHETIDLSGIATGVYLLQLHYADGVIATRRIVKN